MDIDGKCMSEHNKSNTKFKRNSPNRISDENWLFKVQNGCHLVFPFLIYKTFGSVEY